MKRALAVLSAVRGQLRVREVVDSQPEITLVAGAVRDENLVVLLFHWLDNPILFGLVVDVEEMAANFDPNDSEALADVLVTNDLAGPPGLGEVLDVVWASGLTEDPSLVRWIGGSSKSLGR